MDRYGTLSMGAKLLHHLGSPAWDRLKEHYTFDRHEYAERVGGNQVRAGRCDVASVDSILSECERIGPDAGRELLSYVVHYDRLLGVWKFPQS